MEKTEILKWEAEYNKQKYPYGIYLDLVVNQKAHPKKFILMGAWKTGKLRLGPEKEYCDSEGLSYGFNQAWKQSAPVGFRHWHIINEYRSIIQSAVPDQFPIDEPLILRQLAELQGFGYIWAIFTLHLMYPEVYPLYDQHVYRTYKYEISNHRELPKEADKSWEAYADYTRYFKALVMEYSFPFYRVDKALWSHGKALKNKYSFKSKTKMHSQDNMSLSFKNFPDNSWIQSHTLSDKAKPFNWKMNGQGNLEIKRWFQNGQLHHMQIQKAALDQIERYMQGKDWVDLANNVESLHHGTEKEGLGKFLYEELKWNVLEAQLASHLSALFVEIGAWNTNGLKRNIKLNQMLIDLHSLLIEFYARKSSYEPN